MNFKEKDESYSTERIVNLKANVLHGFIDENNFVASLDDTNLVIVDARDDTIKHKSKINLRSKTAFLSKYFILDNHKTYLIQEEIKDKKYKISEQELPEPFKFTKNNCFIESFNSKELFFIDYKRSEHGIDLVNGTFSNRIILYKTIYVGLLRQFSIDKLNELQLNLGERENFAFTLVNKKYVVVLTNEFIQSYDFENEGRKISLNKEDLFKDRKVETDFFLIPFDKQNKFICYKSKDQKRTGYLIEISSTGMTVIKEISFKGELIVKGSYVCWSSADEDCLKVYDTKSHREFKIEIRTRKFFFEVFSESNYFAIMTENEFRIYCPSKGVIVRKLLNVYQNAKDMIFSGKHAVIVYGDNKTAIFEFAIKSDKEKK